ncbi:hypothetical protein CLV35_3486 [Motilibacter peucedani]|uniref:DUF541 domain-containing protein n=1 Tax=Motilibacter peucedani TaxID=598650 RepID=A0A420XL28_9ACTN|nr:SIMPL domain-containing protein [Motilibacter peucedani]RKS69309.1 hypothetical protein CLV35_3486 [Motilibacter peucedani]
MTAAPAQRRAWLAVLVLAALALALLTLAPGGRSEAATPSDPEGVTVSATGRSSAPPDVVRLSLAAEAGAAKSGDALAAASTASRRILAALRASGVAAADVQTTGLQVQPRYTGSRVTGYTARQSVGALVRDVARAGGVVDAAAAAGGAAFRVDGLSYGLEDDEAALTSARKAAFALATERARTYAAAAGRSLGAVLEVVEGSPAQPYASAAAASSGGGGAFDAPSLAPGSLDAAVTVTVRFALG